MIIFIVIPKFCDFIHFKMENTWCIVYEKANLQVYTALDILIRMWRIYELGH